jgi:hypothetical protein
MLFRAVIRERKKGTQVAFAKNACFESIKTIQGVFMMNSF